MVGIRMTSLRRAGDGDWFARKRIPDDVRAQYEAEHGKRQEERFRCSASTFQGTAAQQFRDWDAEVCSRIERLRASVRGEGEATLRRTPIVTDRRTVRHHDAQSNRHRVSTMVEGSRRRVERLSHGLLKKPQCRASVLGGREQPLGQCAAHGEGDMPFSSYDVHGLRLLSHAHAEPMERMQKSLNWPCTQGEKAAFSRRITANLTKAYDSGVREPSALLDAALHTVLLPSA